MSATPPPTDHEAFDALAVGYALHALEPEDEAAFARHLPDCARCRRNVAETHEVMAAMATDLPTADPSEGLRRRLRAAVQTTEQVPAPTLPPARGDSPATDDAAPDHPPRRVEVTPRSVAARRRALAGGLVVAAVATIVGLGVWNVVLTSSREEAMEVAADQRAVLEEVLQPGAQVMATMTDDDGDPMATLITRDGEMTVVTQGLPVNDDTEEIYVLWGVGPGEPVALGSFDVERSRTGVQDVGSGPTGVGPFERYAVSLEPGRQPPANPSEVVADGQVAN